jgi:hypothetical protein
MEKRWVRVLLVLLAAAVLGGIGFEVQRLDRNRSRARVAGRDFERQAHAAVIAVRDLQAAQQATVARGQGEQFWFDRVDTLTALVEEALPRLGALASDTAAAEAVSAATSALGDFRKIDSRARQYVLGGQHLLASDLIFADGLQVTAAVGRRIEEAAASEQAIREREDAGLRRIQMYLLGGVGSVLFLAALVLLGAVSGGGPSRSVEPMIAPGPGGEDGTPARRLALRDLQALEKIISQPEAGVASHRPSPGQRPPATEAVSRPVRLPDHPAEPAEREWTEAHEDEPAALAGDRVSPGTPPSGAPAFPRVPDLADTARLCADFARVAEAQELPGLLDRAASVLGASGVVVWVQNPAGTALIPAVGHGYSPGVMSRMQPIARDADNFVADAYRAGELRVVPAGDDSKGAIVTPLITPSGPVGVLSAEVSGGVEASNVVQAIATIIAAQLATLIPGPPAPAN